MSRPAEEGRPPIPSRSASDPSRQRSATVTGTLRPQGSFTQGSPSLGPATPSQTPRDAPILRESVFRSAETTDWSTIDWIHTNEQHDRTRTSNRDKMSRRGRAGYREDLRHAFSSSQGWLSAVVAGFCLGVIAVMIEACTHFVVNFRIGICSNFFWLSPSLCCAYRGGEEECESYYTWGEYFGGRDGRHVEFINFTFYVFWTVFFAAVSSFFCKVYCPFAAGGGINEVKTIVSGQQVKRYLGGWTLVTKCVGVCMSTGSGLAVGKEGPFVHIGSCVGDLVSGLFPNYRLEGKRRELISAGAAGGMAVAFGAPVGGVIFSLEEISSFYSFKAMMQALMCGVTAVLVVKRVDMEHSGRIVQFSINYQHAWHWFELPFFALIGIVGGLIGSLYNHVNIKWGRRRKAQFKQWKVTEIVILATISATLNYIIPFCKGSMLELLADLYQDCTPGSKLEICEEDGTISTMIYLILAGIMKMSLCAITVGSCVPAGLLVPSLCVGALFGRAFGIFLQAVQQSYSGFQFFSECFGHTQCIVPGAYAIVGSAAVLTGVTRMTICLAVIMFELTGGLEYLVPVIVAILMSKWAGEALGTESIYELGIEENELPYLDPKKEFYFDYDACDIYEGTNFTTIPSTGMSLRKLNDVLDGNAFTGFPVVMSKTDNTLIGYITRKDMIRAIQETAIRAEKGVTASTLVRFRKRDPGETPSGNELNEQDYSDYVNGSSLQVEPECSVSRLLYLFKSLGTRHVLVTQYSKFHGYVTKKDLIDFMRKVEHEHHEQEHEHH